MARTLDRSRKFSTSYGETTLRYYQDGTYFDAAGASVDVPPQENRTEPPQGAGKPAGKVLAGAKATSIASDASVAPPANDAEERAQLAQFKVTQVKSIFLKAGGDPDLAKGAGSQARMIDWLMAKAATEREAAGG
jgi:hypothetical protein